MKNKVTTILIIVATVILAGVAIFTATRLYNLRDESVAPSAPESKPQAAIPEACDALTFTLLEPGLNCTKKQAWEDDPKNEPGNYYLTTPILANSDLIPGQVVVYSVSYKNTGDASSTGATITDVLPTQLEFLDDDGGCAYTSQNELACEIGEVIAGGESQVSFRVKVKESVSAGILTNTAEFIPNEGDESVCSISLNIQVEESSTPTPTITATPTSTPGPTTTPTLTPGPTTTPGPTSTPSPTEEPQLPPAGIGTPTIVGMGAGILILLISLALAL